MPDVPLSRSRGVPDHPPKAEPRREPIAPPPAQRPPPDGYRFAVEDLARLRRELASLALREGFGHERTAEWVLAVDELLSNAIRHGGGSGTMRCWVDGGRLVAEIDDADPTATTRLEPRLPAPNEVGGRGIWLVQRFADRIEVGRTGGRLHVRVTFSAEPAESGLTPPTPLRPDHSTPR